MHARLFASTSGLLLALAPGVAFAQYDPAQFVTGGALFSAGWGNESNTAFGAEGSFVQYPGERPFAFGVVLQLQVYTDGSVRVGAGVQGNVYLTGLELGLAYRTGTAAHDGTLGVHIAPFLSAGYVSSAFRLTLPLSSALHAYRTEYAFSVALKYSTRIDDSYADPFNCFFGCAVVGRPLRDGPHNVTAPMVASRDWSGDAARGERSHAAVARLWEKSAREEHASVAAFARLSLQLMSLGATPALLGATHRAALDEVDHARRCSAIASRFGGAPVSPGALLGALAPIAALDLASLAVDSLVEGCLGEGSAAALAREGARTAVDEEVRASLEVIAADEARHAALAWQILDWCVATGGDEVRRAILDATRALPARMRDPELVETFDATDEATLAAHGLVSLARQRALWAHTRRDVLRRLALPRGPAIESLAA